MTKPTPLHRHRGKSHGFTLVELMVGLALGLLTVLVITQVIVVSEGKKRTLTMGSDAQVNGALSIFTIQRDVQMAGYGASVIPDALGCATKGKRDSDAEFSFTLAPVVIAAGASGAPDQVTVLLSTKAGFSVPMITSENHPQSTDYFVVKSSFGAVAGDVMIAVPKLQSADVGCAVFNVNPSGSSLLTTTQIPHASGTNGKWNSSSVFPTDGYPDGSYLLNMGSLAQRTYSVSTSNALQMAERSAAVSTPLQQELYSGIVNLQALYGKDTDGDGVIDKYDKTSPTTNDGWRQVLAVRIAVVARSNQPERDEVTTTQPQWDLGNVTVGDLTPSNCYTNSKCVPLKVDQASDWKNYRYKVYDTVIPLRNVLWNS
ncbi:PilW family protein [Variovorax paradoxus]|jgi:type IV pilus assembly protein PilW|uniref:Pilus assembly protein PilW n=1 Tax=Variovorax paradoxus TaxID=34073 RepID=A0A679IUL6_VARPD|nr:hypothetical protein VVAX_00369 [Variovorax paradoxus]